MKNILTTNAWAIWSIAHTNGVDIGIGRDMFVGNLESYGNPDSPSYQGAEGVDYAALSAEWNALSEDERAAEKEQLRQATTALYTQLAECYREGDKTRFDELIASAGA